MTGRFAVDLLHPGRVAQTWQDWFVGTQGRRRFLFALSGCVVVLIIAAVPWIITSLRLSGDQGSLPRLRADLAGRDGELRLLRADLQALSVEAKRQVRWAEVMTALSQQIPPTLKLTKVEALRAGPPPAPSPGQPPPPTPTPVSAGEGELRIEAITPLKPGSPNMLEIAQFMAGLLKDPAVNKRFQLKNWEIKPGTPASGGGQAQGEGEKMIQIIIVLSELGR
ncbi:MAG TPA: hypothetical protein VFO18_08085 [Methylomirabilota bacterium]|nr:hypothetical protein [Methylomirabilota bacterium]